MQTRSNALQKSVPSQPTLLIAGCGYLGSVVAERWLALGGSVWALTRSEVKAQRLRALGIEPMVVDLADADAFGPHQLPETSAVLWAVGFDRSSQATRQSVWIDGLSRFLQALPAAVPQRRLIYVSSTAVYGDAQGRDVDETTVPVPTTASGQLCLAAEKRLRETLSAVHPGTIPAILRLAGIFGPDRLLQRTQELMAGVPMKTAPDEWLNLIHVDDAANLITAMARTPAPMITSPANAAAAASDRIHLPPVMNVANQQTLTRRLYYSELARIVGAPEPVFVSGAATTTPSVSRDTPAGNASPGNPSSGNTAPGNTATSESSSGNGPLNFVNPVERVQRESSGNKRVTSIHRTALPGFRFQFDNVIEGIADACRRSQF